MFLKPLQNSSVMLPNHTSIHVSLYGDVKISSKILLEDVLFMPQFRLNLISVSALTNDTRVTLTFMPDSFVLQDITNKKTIGRGERLDGLYVLDANNCGLLSTDLNPVSHFSMNNVTAKI